MTTPTLDERNLAESILAGMTLPYGQNGWASSDDWIEAANMALDPIEQDWATFRRMMAREVAAEEFGHWQYVGEVRGIASREFTDFDDWCERHAPECLPRSARWLATAGVR